MLLFFIGVGLIVYAAMTATPATRVSVLDEFKQLKGKDRIAAAAAALGFLAIVLGVFT